MKTHISDPFGRPFAALARIFNRRQPRERRKRTLFPLFAPVLLAGLAFLPAGRVLAQTFTVLHSFTALPAPYSGANSDGANPNAGLVLSGNTLYGTAVFGGSAGLGTVFAVNIDSTGFTNLHNFNGSAGGGLAGLIL